MKRIGFYTIIVMLGVSFFTSCEEKGLLTNANDVSYIAFEKDMTADTTGVTFKFYKEGEDAEIVLGVTISGKVQDKDLEYTVGIDPKRTTLPASQYELPEKCVIKAGELTGEIAVVLKYYETLDTKAEILALQVNEGGEVRQGPSVYSRAIISVSNLLFAPEWWTRNDGDVDIPYNIVESWYLGRYSEKKYIMFLDELKKDGVIFDGKDMFILRKYALRLKNTIKDYNAQHPDAPMSDEYGKMEIPVAG